MRRKTLAKAAPILLIQGSIAQEGPATKFLNCSEIHAQSPRLVLQLKRLADARRGNFENMAKCNVIAMKCTEVSGSSRLLNFSPSAPGASRKSVGICANSG